MANALCNHCTVAWVTRPERPKGAKDKVKQARRAQRGPQARSLVMLYCLSNGLWWWQQYWLLWYCMFRIVCQCLHPLCLFYSGSMQQRYKNIKKGQHKYDKRTTYVWQKDNTNMTNGQNKYDRRTTQIWRKDKSNMTEEQYKYDKR